MPFKKTSPLFFFFFWPGETAWFFGKAIASVMAPSLARCGTPRWVWRNLLCLPLGGLPTASETHPLPTISFLNSLANGAPPFAGEKS